MTNGWTDIRNADVVLAMGGNPAENHPVGFRFVMEAKRNRNAKLIAVDPRFHRTAAVADAFVQIRAGTDIAFLGGIINYALTRKRYHEEYVRLFTNATFLVKDGYAFDETRGVFSGWNEERNAYTDTSSWNYELDERGFARIDESMTHARSVFQVMKAFYARYTPAAVAGICGCRAEDFEKAAELITSTFTSDRVGTIMYALGWTHHSHSVQLIHAAAMLQLLLGNIGRPGGGLNALRGHANIQGGTDCGMAYHNLPGYIAIPKADHPTLTTFLEAVTPKPLRPNVTNFWSGTDRFTVSQLKAYYGSQATKANDFGYQLHPRLPQSDAGGYENWSWAYIFDRMYRGDMEGFISFGMNPVSNGPHSRKVVDALSKLKWLAWPRTSSRRPRRSGAKTFWRSPTKSPRTSRPKSFCCRRPTSPRRTDRSSTRRAGFSGSGKRSIRRATRSPIRRSSPACFSPFERCTRKRAERIRSRCVRSTGGTRIQQCPSLDEVAREINGWAIDDVRDASGAMTLRAGQQLARAADLRADGTTLSGNWLYIGDVHRRRQPDATPVVQRLERSRPLPGLGLQLAGQPAHPLQPLLR